MEWNVIWNIQGVECSIEYTRYGVM